MASNVENVELNQASHNSNYVLSCGVDGFKYHIWLHMVDGALEAISGMPLYKNPPAGPGPCDPGYFTTRKLDKDGALGRKIIPAMFAAMHEQRLHQKLLVDQAIKALQAAEDQATNQRKKEIVAAAPQLFALLEEIAAKAEAALKANPSHDMNDIALSARAGLALVNPSTEPTTVEPDAGNMTQNLGAATADLVAAYSAAYSVTRSKLPDLRGAMRSYLDLCAALVEKVSAEQRWTTVNAYLSRLSELRSGSVQQGGEWQIHVLTWLHGDGASNLRTALGLPAPLEADQDAVQRQHERCRS